ncbi:MAG TPA: hypothetical protein VGR40_00810, partial [Candidatus Binatus sp.]|nr:hypothetical protein [Candidatus Binatus sp.]
PGRANLLVGGPSPMFRFVLRIVAAFVAVVLMGSGAAWADMANGSYSFDFSGIVALWDISGSYSGGIGPFSISFAITETPSGKLSGNGTFNVEGLDGNIKSVSGGLKGSSNQPHVAMNMRMSGTGELHGIHARVSFSANMHYQLNSGDHGLVNPRGSGTLTVTDLATGQTASQSGSFKRSALTSLELPIESTGAWGLSLDLTPNGNSYTGTASVELSTGATADFTVTGTYDSASDTSKIALVGDAGKLSLVISTSGAMLNVDTAKGKIFGQTVNYTAGALGGGTGESMTDLSDP